RFKAEQFNVSLISDNTRGFTDTTSAGGTVQLSYWDKIAGRQHHLITGTEYVYNDVANRVFEEKNDRTLATCIAVATEAGEGPGPGLSAQRPEHASGRQTARRQPVCPGHHRGREGPAAAQG